MCVCVHVWEDHQTLSCLAEDVYICRYDNWTDCLADWLALSPSLCVALDFITKKNSVPSKINYAQWPMVY